MSTLGACPPTPPTTAGTVTPPPKGENDVSKEDTTASKLKIPRPSSPESHCAICLGHLDNMSYTNSCFHKFCFTCLLEWSKVRPVCPLCKARFQSIIHTIQSDDNYKSYTLPPPPVEPALGDRIDNLVEAVNRFRYQSTLTRERIAQRQLEQRSGVTVDGGSSRNVGAGAGWRRRRGPATLEFRRQVYERNLYVSPRSLTDVTGRYRECSPQWYRNNPAQIHRLVPWLNREVKMLASRAHSVRITYVVDLILDLILRHDIHSPEFAERLLPYFGTDTEHFQYEFYHFARSVYDVVGFDLHATYDEGPMSMPPPTLEISSDEESDDDDDIEVLGTVQAGSSSSTAVNLTERIRQRLQRFGTLCPSLIVPSVSGPIRTQPNPGMNPLGNSNRDPMLPPPAASPEAGPSNGATPANFSHLVFPQDSSSDEDRVEILEVIPPRSQRPIDVIQLDSSDDEEHPKEPSTSNNAHELNGTVDLVTPVSKPKKNRRRSTERRHHHRRHIASGSSSRSRSNSPRASRKKKKKSRQRDTEVKQEESRVSRDKSKGKGKGKKSRRPITTTSGNSVPCRVVTSANKRDDEDEDEDEEIPFLVKRHKSKKERRTRIAKENPENPVIESKIDGFIGAAAMDRTPLEEYNMDQMSSKDLRLKLLRKEVMSSSGAQAVEIGDDSSTDN